MVACKFYQQGNCRYGQSCRFDHINNFGRQSGEKYGENKSIVLGVAEEVLVAERGGQWPLSCFGPFKEQPSIPGFEDVSPEEVRWEMYQAQKSNTVEQTKQQFQQLCQDAMAKRNVLKNPTRETATMLEKLQKGTPETPAPSSNFLRSTLFSSPPSSGSFGTQGNPQGSPFTTRNFTPTTSSLFSSSTTGAPSMFGGGQTQLFGGATQPGFAPGNQNAFSGGSSGGSIFGGSGNSGNFGATGNLFTSSATTPSTGIFSNTLGGSSVPGIGGNSLFGQKSAVAFGGAPVFGSANFGNAGLFNKPQGSVFGATAVPGTFGTNAGTPSVPGTFGASGTTAAPGTFGASTGTTAVLGTFGASGTAQVPGTFGTAGTTSVPGTFGTTGATPAPGTFETSQGTTSVPGTFGTSGTTQVPGTFGTSGSNTFGTFISSPNASAGANAPFSGGSTFGTGSSSGTSTTTNTKTVPSNPFAPSAQPFVNNPFGTGSATGTFGTGSIDPSFYTPAEALTDEEKSRFAADKFILQRIPLRPPSVEIR